VQASISRKIPNYRGNTAAFCQTGERTDAIEHAPTWSASVLPSVGEL